MTILGMNEKGGKAEESCFKHESEVLQAEENGH